MKYQKGDEIILKLDKMAFEGKAIARTNGIVVFVPDMVPGDVVKVRIIKVKPTYIEGRATVLMEPSPLRVSPRCSYVGTCGGCKMQHVDYSAQLSFKHRQVIDAFERVGSIRGVEVPEPIPAPDIFFYRNKMEFSFSEQRWLTREEIESGEGFNKEFAIGLHVAGRFNKVVDIHECFLQSESSNKILNVLRLYTQERRLKPYSTKNHEGFLRFVVIRESRATQEIMVNMVTSENRPDIMHPLAVHLTEKVPGITTVVNTINRKKAQVATGDEEIVYVGDGRITESIGRFGFNISANSFFQTNTLQSERLYHIAKEFGELSPHEIALDLYCGTGSIALFISDSVKKVYGIDIVGDAIKDARLNASMNKIENAYFLEGNVLDKIEKLREWLKEIPDVVYLDPPRSGLHPGVLHALIKVKIPKIVYVSCNPVTQARDISALVERGYLIDSLQPVDMFPHTYHIENVTRLTLR